MSYYKRVMELSPNSLITILLILSMGCGYDALGQSALVNSINDNLIEVESKQPSDDFANFGKFSDHVSNVNLLAIGEETHGVKEFTDFRGTLIKHLITELNYKVVILEGDFYGIQSLNNYVLYGKGNKYFALLSTGMGIYRTPEFLNIVEWIKSYNLNKLPSEKISFYGCDMQKTATMAYLSTGNIKLKKELSTDAQAGLKIMLGPMDYQVKSADKELIQRLTLELSQEMSKYPDTSIFKRSLYTIIQYAEYFQEKYNYNQSNLRDKFMAENAIWIYEHELKKKTILLAHNSHVAKAPVYNDIKRMGNYLKAKYKDEYYVLGMSFFTGKFSATDGRSHKLSVFDMPEIKNSESVEYIFSQCRVPNFILDFKAGKNNSDINLFLHAKTYTKNIGASFVPNDKDSKLGYMPLNDKFDGIAFFRKISPLPFPFPWDKK